MQKLFSQLRKVKWQALVAVFTVGVMILGINFSGMNVLANEDTTLEELQLELQLSDEEFQDIPLKTKEKLKEKSSEEKKKLKAKLDGLKEEIKTAKAEWKANYNSVFLKSEEEQKKLLGMNPPNEIEKEKAQKISEDKKKLKKEKKNKTEIGTTNDGTGDGIIVEEGVQETTTGENTKDIGIPSSFDWRNVDGKNYITPIRDQASCGSCWAFAAAAALESSINIHNNNPDLDVDLSEQDLVSCYLGDGCDGANVAEIENLFSNYYQNTGIVTESCFPYNASDASCNKCSESPWKTTSYVNINVANNDNLKSALVEHGPVEVGMKVYSDFYAYSGGIYSHTSGNSSDYHAVTIVGYGTENNTDYWIVKNSWGTNWGESGYFRIAEGDSMIDSWFAFAVVDPISPAGAPQLSLTPTQISTQVQTGATTTETLTISNTGEGTLNWNITQSDYQALDSNQTNGPTYNWQDISTTGTALSLGDDDAEQISLPFNFPFYGATKNTVKISSNGYLTFGSNGTDYTNDSIPNTTDPNDFIAPFWDDLNPSSSGTVYYYSDTANQRFIVQYEAVVRYYTSTPNTFQVILAPNGEILFQYQDMQGSLNSATIGLENATGSAGLQVAYNEDYVTNNLAVLIKQSANWLSVAPTSGAITGSNSQALTVTLDATNLAVGTYNENLTIQSNDPDDQSVVVPVTLTVTAGQSGCTPPATGDWLITQTCTFTGTATAPASVIVDNNAVLTIDNTAVLNIDFANYELRVKDGSGVLIQDGGEIRSGTSEPPPSDCTPPATGDWLITQTCTFTGTATAPGSVIVDQNAVLTIDNTAVLNLDFGNHELRVKDGSGVLIQDGGEIH